MATIYPGIDIAAQSDFAFLKGAKVGALANPASVDTQGNHLVGLLRKSCQGRLSTIFAPEHGYSGHAQDMEAVDDTQDPDSGIIIKSLYGDTQASLSPMTEDFAGLDILVVDLPDIGTRYYTFSQTMAYCMKVAGEAGVKVVVLDRPNPIGGAQIEGSPITKTCRSFCGIGPVANRHGMTLGELAKLFRAGFGECDAAIEPHECELAIIQVQGWKRSKYLDETHIPWTRPSPNMPTLETAIVYPGTCLFEATNLSEGRGTSRPFEMLGAPYIDSQTWIDATQKVGIPLQGARLHAVEFTPQFQKHAGKLCRGIQIQVEDRKVFQPYRLGLALLIAAAKSFPEDFQWRKDPYEFIGDVPAIDLLYGSNTLRKVIEERNSVESVLEELKAFEDWYSSARKPFLLY